MKNLSEFSSERFTFLENCGMIVKIICIMVRIVWYRYWQNGLLKIIRTIKRSLCGRLTAPYAVF